jgi:hypothetical protein
MGRHSAPDDDDEADAPVVVATEPGAALRGRHTRGEDVEDTGPVAGTEMRSPEGRAAAQDEQPTELIPLQDLLTEPPEGEVTAPVEVPEPEPKGKEKGPGRGDHSTAADLALLRRRADVRNRVLGAVLVPFVLYAAVLVVLGARGVQYLLWIWIPLVSAGVLAGLIGLAPGTGRRNRDAKRGNRPSARGRSINRSFGSSSIQVGMATAAVTRKRCGDTSVKVTFGMTPWRPSAIGSACREIWLPMQ